MNAQTNKRGFTIIEVVLVLAIAALIFLMIFVALPALQRGQTNTARKNEVGTVASAVSTYRSNNNGSVPTTYAQMSSYVDLNQTALKVGNLPTGATTYVADATTLDKITIVTNAKCGGAGTIAGTSTKDVSVLTTVETGAGKYASYCQGV